MKKIITTAAATLAISLVSPTNVLAEDIRPYYGYLAKINNRMTQERNPFIAYSDEEKIKDGKNICLALGSGVTYKQVMQTLANNTVEIRNQYSDRMGDYFVQYWSATSVFAVVDICPVFTNDMKAYLSTGN